MRLPAPGLVAGHCLPFILVTRASYYTPCVWRRRRHTYALCRGDARGWVVVGGYNIPPSAARGVDRARGRGRAPARVYCVRCRRRRDVRARPRSPYPCSGGRSERARRRTRGLSSLQSDGRRSRPRVHDRYYYNGNIINRSTAGQPRFDAILLYASNNDLRVGEPAAATEREQHHSTIANPELTAPKTPEATTY